MAELTRDRPRRVAVARWCSDVGSPPVFTALTLAQGASHGQAGAGTVVAWSLGLSLLLAGVPLAYVLMLVQRGRVTDIHLPLRRERRGPIAVTLIAAVAAIVVARELAAPRLLQQVLLAALLQTLLLGLITLWWQISFHTAAAALFAGVAVVLWGPSASPLLLLVALIGWARVELDRHTLAQVLAGSVVGLLPLLWL